MAHRSSSGTATPVATDSSAVTPLQAQDLLGGDQLAGLDTGTSTGGSTSSDVPFDPLAQDQVNRLLNNNDGSPT